MGRTLFEKVFARHTVRELASGQFQLFMGLHYVHEATSPQAFSMLRERGLRVLCPARTCVTADHVIPTDDVRRPYRDALAENMLAALEQNVSEFELRYFSPARKRHGIVHVLGPERGLTQPGMTICCGDSHTSTHGAFGAIAFGIGTSQMRDVLATQTLAMSKLKVRRIEINGALRRGVYAKDVALHLISRLGVNAGLGFAHEYAGEVVDRLAMDGRMTLCNLAVEGGARCGYVNPDEVTYSYLKNREFAPTGAAWDRARAYWDSIRSDADAAYDDIVRFDGKDIEPMVSWGINPSHATAVGTNIPIAAAFSPEDRSTAEEAYAFMGMAPGQPVQGTRIDVAFIGSCTNGRLSDFEEVARCLQSGNFKVAPHVKALIVPGSQHVRDELVRRGMDRVFTAAGFEFREPGCSMCIAMNTDRLEGRQVCASSSNRNFKGRQGSPTGRTLLMSPVMVAAAALAGEVVDARQVFNIAPKS
jgi:3-isopropylmalate/(R)-2-methylmalate dehydratase large subunit